MVRSIGFMQAVPGRVGGAVLMVVPRTIIRDIRIAPAATRLMAILLPVISIRPFLAPLAGSVLIAVWHRRSVFQLPGGAELAQPVPGKRAVLA